MVVLIIIGVIVGLFVLFIVLGIILNKKEEKQIKELEIRSAAGDVEAIQKLNEIKQQKEEAEKEKRVKKEKAEKEKELKKELKLRLNGDMVEKSGILALSVIYRMMLRQKHLIL